MKFAYQWSIRANLILSLLLVIMVAAEYAFLARLESNDTFTNLKKSKSSKEHWMQNDAAIYIRFIEISNTIITQKQFDKYSTKPIKCWPNREAMVHLLLSPVLERTGIISTTGWN